MIDNHKLSWAEAFSVGYDPIDSQHKEIIDLYNLLCEASGPEDIRLAEDILGDYVAKHFAYEGEVMARHAYPDRAAHMADHQRLIRMYAAIKERGEDTATVMKLVVYKWFVEHVISDRMDMHLGRFLSARTG